MSVQVSYKKQFLFFLILIFIVLIITEGSVRYVEFISQSCDFIKSNLFDGFNDYEKSEICSEYKGIKYDVEKPYSMLEPNQKGKFVNINSDGFRGSEIDWNDEKYKIFFLGGSTTYGAVTTSDKSTIPGFVQQKMNEKGIEVTIINAGMSAASSVDELYIIKEHILKFEPDMIIMYDGWNDVAHTQELKFDISYEQYLENDFFTNSEIVEKINNIDKSLIHQFGNKLLILFTDIDYRTGIGILINFYKTYTANVDEKSSDVSLIKLDRIESNLKQNWSEVCELGKTYEFQTVNLLQPILGTSDRILHPDEIKILVENEPLKYLKNIDLEGGLESCKNIIDLRNSLYGMDNVVVYFDIGHMNDFGYEIMAEEIVEKITPLVQDEISK